MDVYKVINTSGGEEALATNGQLRIFARCLINDAGLDRIQFVATSTDNGWYHEDGGATEFLAGDEVILVTEFTVCVHLSLLALPASV